MRSQAEPTVWLTGLPCSGKSTLAALLSEAIRMRGLRVEVLDGDVVRARYWSELGFSEHDRALNVRRLAHLADLLTKNGVVTIVAAVSPSRAIRDEAREQLSSFVEVFVDCPVEICEARDVKGMYRRARAGALPNFTGVGASYEPPPAAEIVVRTDRETAQASAGRILSYLFERAASTRATPNVIEPLPNERGAT